MTFIEMFDGTEEIRQPTEQQKRAIALESIYLILSCAQATGTDEDIPEGSRCISISDTLRNSMLRTLEAYVEKGWEYLLEDQKNRRE